MFYLIKLFCFRLFSSVGVYLPLQSVEDRANLEFFGEICSFIQRYLYFLCVYVAYSSFAFRKSVVKEKRKLGMTYRNQFRTLFCIWLFSYVFSATKQNCNQFWVIPAKCIGICMDPNMFVSLFFIFIFNKWGKKSVYFLYLINYCALFQ